jgi:predicted nucleotidyltransferase
VSLDLIEVFVISMFAKGTSHFLSDFNILVDLIAAGSWNLFHIEMRLESLLILLEVHAMLKGLLL